MTASKAVPLTPYSAYLNGEEAWVAPATGDHARGCDGTEMRRLDRPGSCEKSRYGNKGFVGRTYAVENTLCARDSPV